MKWINTLLLIEELKSASGSELEVKHRITGSISDVYFIKFDSNLKKFTIEVGCLRFCIDEFEFKQQFINHYWNII